jgi:hypothetical protein
MELVGSLPSSQNHSIGRYPDSVELGPQYQFQIHFISHLICACVSKDDHFLDVTGSVNAVYRLEASTFELLQT